MAVCTWCAENETKIGYQSTVRCQHRSCMMENIIDINFDFEPDLGVFMDKNQPRARRQKRPDIVMVAGRRQLLYVVYFGSVYHHEIETSATRMNFGSNIILHPYRYGRGRYRRLMWTAVPKVLTEHQAPRVLRDFMVECDSQIRATARRCQRYDYICHGKITVHLHEVLKRSAHRSGKSSWSEYGDLRIRKHLKRTSCAEISGECESAILK